MIAVDACLLFVSLSQSFAFVIAMAMSLTDDTVHIMLAPIANVSFLMDQPLGVSNRISDLNLDVD